MAFATSQMDRSISYVRPSEMVSRSGSYFVAGVCAVSTFGTSVMMAWDGERDPAAYLQVFGLMVAIASVPFGLGWLGRRLGYTDRAVEAHAQLGGTREMTDAQSTLRLTPDELKRSRRL